jgi:hypothetical protein
VLMFLSNFMVLFLPRQISPLMLLIQLQMPVANLSRVLLGNMQYLY